MRQLFARGRGLSRYGDMNSLLERISEKSRLTKLLVDRLINPVFIVIMMCE